MPAAVKNNNKPPNGKNGADGNQRQAPATGPIYDGPADTASGPSSGRGGANTPGPVQPVRRDPGREPVVNKNIDLPGSAYNLYNQVSSLHWLVWLEVLFARTAILMIRTLQHCSLWFQKLGFTQLVSIHASLRKHSCFHSRPSIHHHP